MVLRCLQGDDTRQLRGRTGRGDAGGTDSLVEVRLWLFTLDCGGEGVDGLIGAEHGGVPHRVVSLGTGAQAASPRAPAAIPSPSFIPHYLKCHHAQACQHQQLSQALVTLPQGS